MLSGIVLLAFAAPQLPEERPASAICLSGTDRCVVERWPRSPLTVYFSDGNDRLTRREAKVLRRFAAQHRDFAAWHPYICAPENDSRVVARVKLLRETLTRAGYKKVTVVRSGHGCRLDDSADRATATTAYRLDISLPPGL